MSDENKPTERAPTWADKHGATAVAVVAGILLVLLMVFQTSC